MSSTRVIARLDIKGPNLVKGIHLEGLRVLGKPQDFAKYYYDSGIDELIFMDVVASLYNRNSLHDIISMTAHEIFIPLTVGGGLRTISDIKNVLRAGADKVSLNTAAIKNKKLVYEASRIFGSSTIVVAIEAIKQSNGSYLAYINNGREHTGIEVLSWAKEVEELGAGEILLTSVDKEGTGRGFDLELINLVSPAVSIPVVAHGGAGCLKHVSEAVTIGNADAVAISSLLHYEYIKSHRDIDGYEKEGNVSFLNSGKLFSSFGSVSVNDVKKQFKSEKLFVRG